MQLIAFTLALKAHLRDTKISREEVGEQDSSRTGVVNRLAEQAVDLPWSCHALTDICTRGPQVLAGLGAERVAARRI